MPQASAISSMALSSAMEPVASPGARMNSGVPVSRRTTSCEVVISTGWRRACATRRTAGSKKSSKVLEVVRVW